MLNGTIARMGFDRSHLGRYVVVTGFLVLAIAWRFIAPVLGFAPNLELLTATSFIAAALLSPRIAWLVPLIGVAVSDLGLGNNLLLLFTWGAWIVIAIAAQLPARISIHNRMRRLLGAVGFGIGATGFFFAVTNFGFWLLFQEFFSPGLTGLGEAYVAGLPFLANQLIGNLFLLPASGVIVDLVIRAERAGQRQVFSEHAG